MNRDIKDPVQISADDNRVLCVACKKPFEPSELIENGFYCPSCEADLMDDDLF